MVHTHAKYTVHWILFIVAARNQHSQVDFFPSEHALFAMVEVATHDLVHFAFL